VTNSITKGLGWQRDLPDPHDYSIGHDEVRELIQDLKGLKLQPDYVDWREYCMGVDDQSNCNTSAANACVGLLQYYERRASGRIIDPSRMFVYKTARRLLNCTGDNGANLRATWKAIVRFGVATERIWPFDPQKLDVEPDAFAYSFDKRFSSIRYVRLDRTGNTGDDNLRSVKAFLAAGFASVFGFTVHDSIGQDPDIDFPSTYDTATGGQAVMAVGYDDNHRYRSSKGALLVKNSWGKDWGEAGYGWLPYDYVRKQLAADFWIILRPEWLSSGEFHQP
jgi:C1A family cysteine protease